MPESDSQQSPEVEIAAACERLEGSSGHFCLVADSPAGGRFAILGDVVGSGQMVTRAAGHVRERCAAFTAHTSDPATLLQLANDSLLERPPGLRELVSAVCLHYQPRGALLTWALAGHPSPLVLPELKPLTDLARTSLLGLHPGLEPQTKAAPLTPAAGVLAFTAETVDTPRGGERLGQGRLAEIAADHVDRPTTELVRRTHRAVVSWSEAIDPAEVCLLALRRR